MGKWQIATCEECGAEVPYLPEWDEPRFCKACRFHEQACAICGEAMRIGRDWEHPPTVHKECREQAQQARAERNARWFDQRCRECGVAFRVCRDWDRLPEFCKQCAWHEIPCGICERSMRVHRGWTNPPWAHKDCLSEYRQRSVECGDCGAEIVLSTRFQVTCRKNGWELPRRCAQCKHDGLLIRAAIGALRDEFKVPLEATIERRGMILTSAVAIVQEKRTGRVVAEVTMDKEGILFFTHRVAVATEPQSGRTISRTCEGHWSLLTWQRTAETSDARSDKRTHVSRDETRGLIVPSRVTSTTNTTTGKTVSTTTRRRGFLDWLLRRTAYESEEP